MFNFIEDNRLVITKKIVYLRFDIAIRICVLYQLQSRIKSVKLRLTLSDFSVYALIRLYSIYSNKTLQCIL